MFKLYETQSPAQQLDLAVRVKTPSQLARTFAAYLLDLVRENLRLLAELARCYEVGLVGAPAEERVVRCPGDIAAYLGAELADLAQEQLRVVLLDTKNRVAGVQLVYQGGINATA